MSHQAGDLCALASILSKDFLNTDILSDSKASLLGLINAANMIMGYIWIGKAETVLTSHIMPHLYLHFQGLDGVTA